MTARRALSRLWPVVIAFALGRALVFPDAPFLLHAATLALLLFAGMRIERANRINSRRKEA